MKVGKVFKGLLKKKWDKKTNCPKSLALLELNIRI